MLSTGHAVAAIAVMAAVTFLTRFLPFLLFDRGEAPPKIVLYLGRVLPPAIIAMLVVYCLRHVSLLQGSHGLPELIAILLTVGLHLWKRQMLLSIAGGTVCYMLLIQFIF